MILLEIPESIRAIGGFILALVLGYLVLFIPTALFSKVFNVNIQTRGNREPNITPQSLDIIPIIYKKSSREVFKCLTSNFEKDIL
jgi:hypothetical protein